MAIPVNELPAVDPDSGRVNVVVDTPQGSRNKYKFDEQHGQWRLSKVLPQGMYFPYDFGFIPSTRGEDGDPLDVLLLADEPSFPGCIVPAHLIGVLEAEQTEGGKTIRNDLSCWPSTAGIAKKVNIAPNPRWPAKTDANA